MTRLKEVGAEGRWPSAPVGRFRLNEIGNQKRDELVFVALVIPLGKAALSHRAATEPRPGQARECRQRLRLPVCTAQV